MTDVAAVVRHARDLLARSAGRRVLLGITGPPGAGKSTVAAALADALGVERCVLVPMDGFHLSDSVLITRGARERKGAPDTFDVDGYVTLLQRLRTATDVVYAPSFRRELELAEAGAIVVPGDVPLVVTEGNYLLTWPGVRSLLDEVWYLDVPDDERRRRLVDRRIALGQDQPTAVRWAEGSDQRNADIVAVNRADADRVLPG